MGRLLAALIANSASEPVANPANVANVGPSVPPRFADSQDSRGVRFLESEAANDVPIREWRITYPNGAAMDVLFHPPATRADVAAIYPGASLEPLPDAPKHQATPDEAAELRELVAVVLANDTEAERAEALRVACADPEAALDCYRSLAANAAPGI